MMKLKRCELLQLNTLFFIKGVTVKKFTRSRLFLILQFVLTYCMAVTGGPFRDFKWGGISLRPTKDGDAEWDVSGFDFEAEASPNGDDYSTGTARIGYVQQECAMTASEFNALKRMQDGAKRSGVATCPNGDVLSLNAALDGEINLSGGKATIKLAGKVKLQ